VEPEAVDDVTPRGDIGVDEPEAPLEGELLDDVEEAEDDPGCPLMVATEVVDITLDALDEDETPEPVDDVGLERLPCLL